MADIGSVEATLRLRDEFSASLKKAASGLGGLTTQAKPVARALVDLQAALDRLGRADGLRSSASALAQTLAALRAQNRALAENLTAHRAGVQAVAALNNQRQIAATLLRAGASAQGQYGQLIAQEVTKQQQARAAIEQTIEARKREAAATRQAAAAAEEAARRQFAAMQRSAQASMQQVVGGGRGRLAVLPGLQGQTAALQQEVAAARQGAAAIAALNQQRAISNALTKAGVPAQSALGRAITAEIQKQHQLRAALQQTTVAKRSWLAALGRSSAAMLGFGAGIAGIMFALQRLGRALVETQRRYQALMLRFEAGVGSPKKAGEAFDFAHKTALRYGLSLEAVADSYSRFVNVTRGTLIQGEEARRVFTALSKATAALGLDATRTNLAFLAVEQMVSKNSVQMEELRRQLAEQIPSAFLDAAKASGLTTTEFTKQIREGKVLATDILPKLATIWEEKFGDAAVKNAERLTGVLNEMKSEWFLLKQGVGDSDTMVTVFKGIAELLRDASDALKELNKEYGEFLKKTEKSVGRELSNDERVAAKVVTGRGLVGSTLTGMFGGVSDEFLTKLIQANDSLKAKQADLSGETQRLTDAYFELAGALDITVEAAKKLIDAGEFEIRKNGEVKESVTRLRGKIETELNAIKRLYNDLAVAVDEELEKIAKEEKKAAEELADRIDDYRRELSDAARVNEFFRASLGTTILDYERAAMQADAYAKVLNLLGTTSGATAQRLIADTLARAQADKALADEKERLIAQDKKADELFERLAEQRTKLAERERDALTKLKADRAKMDASIALTIASLEAEAGIARDHAIAVAGGADALREFNIQLEIARQIAAFSANEKLLIGPEDVARIEKATRDLFAFNEEADRLLEIQQTWAQVRNRIERGVRQSFESAARALLDGSEDAGEIFAKTVEDAVKGSIAEAFAQLALDFGKALISAAVRAAVIASGGSGSGGGGGTNWIGMLTTAYKAWQSGSSFWGTLFGSSGGAAGTSGAAGYAALDAVSVGQAGGVTTTASYSGYSATSAGSTAGAAWGAAFFAAFVIAVKIMSANTRRKYATETAAMVELTDGEIRASMAGRLKGTREKIANALAEALSGVVSALADSGTLLQNLQQVTVTARNDKRWFQAFVGDRMIGMFGTIQEAVLEGLRYALLESPAAQQLDPLIRQVIQNYQGTAEGLVTALNRVNELMVEAGGLDAFDIALRNLANGFSAMLQELRNFGLRGAEAMQLSVDTIISRFEGAWRQLSGEQMSPAELKAQAEARRDLLVAQMKLVEIELQMRAEFLRAEIARVKAGGQLIEVEFENWRGYLKGRTIFVKATAKLLEAELAVIEEALKALSILIPKVKFGKINIDFGGSVKDFGNSVRNLRDVWRDIAKDFREIIMDARTNAATTPLAPRNALMEIVSQFTTALSAARTGDISAFERARDLYTDVLTAAKQFTGGGTGLGFLGIGGDTFPEFFRALEAMSLDVVNGPIPSTLREGNLLFDERFHRGQERQVEATRTLNENNTRQNLKILEVDRDIYTVQRQQLTELKKIVSAGGGGSVTKAL